MAWADDMAAIPTRWSALSIAAGLLVAMAITACGTASRQAPAPSVQPDSGRPTARTTAPARQDSARRGYSEADVRFMQGMIAHHAQALAMTALVPARTRRADILLLAERIEVSQRDEIAAMERWLKRRGEAVPALDAHHQHHGGAGQDTTMPGMLTAAELARLAGASGAEFERLFLEFMIRHHEGALVMVAQLFGAPGAAQDSQLFRLATDVDADQRAEIARMRRMKL